MANLTIDNEMVPILSYTKFDVGKANDHLATTKEEHGLQSRTWCRKFPH